MSVDAGTIYSGVRVKLDALNRDVKAVQSEFDKISGAVGKTKSSTNALNNEFSKLTKSIVSGQLVYDGIKRAMGAVVGFTKEAITASIDAQETFGKYDEVFEGMGEQSEEAAQRFAKAFDLAGVTAKDMLSNTGNLLQGFGATKRESLEMAEAVNTLASDLASFTNYSGGAKGASEALTKALLGERESAKGLGIAILESDVQVELARKGQQGLTGEALKLAKAQATLEIITRQAKNSIGDYARTSDSASNTLKRAKESTLELKVALGTSLNPATTLAADLWERVASALADTIKHQNELKGARKAEKENNLTLEQRLVLLNKEKSDLQDLLGVEENIAKQYEIADTAEGKRLKTELSSLDAQIAGMERFKKSYESGQIAKAEADALAEEAARKREEQLKIEQEQINKRKEAEKEYQKALAFTKYQLENGLSTNADANKANLSAAESYIKELYKLGYASESEIGTIGYNALQSLIEKYPELIALTKEAKEETASFGLGFEELAKIQQEFVKTGKYVYSGLKDVVSAYFDYESSTLDANYKKNKDYILASTASEEEKAAAIEKLDKDTAKQKAIIAQKQAVWDKANTVAQIGMNTAEAITSALTIPPPFGEIAAGIVAGLAAAQLGFVVATPLPPIPAFETGGIVPGSSYTGDNMLASVNSGEMILNQQQQARLWNELSGLRNGANGGNITVVSVLDGKKVSRSVTRRQRTNNA